MRRHVRADHRWWSSLPSRVLAVCILAALLPVGASAQGGPDGGLVRYRWPVSGQVVRAFEVTGAYAAGHRGVDLGVVTGQAVRPMAPGAVTFAGPVAGVRWVTVAHADGLRTSYGPLTSIEVARGEVVDRGDHLGRAAGDAHGATAVRGRGLLHVGARTADGTYVDPARLVGPPDVPTLVGDVDRELGVGPADPRPVLVAGTPPSASHLVVLAGFTSETGHLPFDPAELGYGPGEWTQFSYRGPGDDGQPVPYGAEDTWQDVHTSAERLRDQLRAFAAANPGRAVDLVGHSLGGLVGVYYLLVLHDPTDPSLPPIGKVVTLASPLQGADAATVMGRWQDDPVLDALLELGLAQFAPGMSDDAPVVGDLATGSEVGAAIDAAWHRHREDPWTGPLANGTDLLTIGGLLDLVVPEHRSDLPGADHETVVGDHSGTPSHERTLELLHAFLGSTGPPGTTPTDLAAELLAPLTGHLSVLEQLLGALLELPGG